MPSNFPSVETVCRLYSPADFLLAGGNVRNRQFFSLPYFIILPFGFGTGGRLTFRQTFRRFLGRWKGRSVGKWYLGDMIRKRVEGAEGDCCTFLRNSRRRKRTVGMGANGSRGGLNGVSKFVASRMSHPNGSSQKMRATCLGMFGRR